MRNERPSLFQFRSMTGNPPGLRPVLSYDFNTPPRNDGLYTCRHHPFIPHHVGQEVVFGDKVDEIEAKGVVQEIEVRFVRVRFLEWL